MLAMLQTPSSAQLHFLPMHPLLLLLVGCLYQFSLKEAANMVATGKWYLRSDDANALGVNKKTFNKHVKLGNMQIFHEYGSKLHVPRPFDQNVFYYVSGIGIDASSEKTLTLPQWVHMCIQLEEFMDKNPNVLPPPPIIDCLSAYSGQDCSNCNLMEILAIVNKLHLEKTLKFMKDFVLESPVQNQSRNADGTTAAPITTTGNSVTPSPKQKANDMTKGKAHEDKASDSSLCEMEYECQGLQSDKIDQFERLPYSTINHACISSLSHTLPSCTHFEKLPHSAIMHKF